jgi:hypothetical protein
MGTERGEGAVTRDEFERLQAGLSVEARRAVETAAMMESFLAAIQEADRLERREIEALKRRAKFKVVR